MGGFEIKFKNSRYAKISFQGNISDLETYLNENQFVKLIMKITTENFEPTEKTQIGIINTDTIKSIQPT